MEGWATREEMGVLYDEEASGGFTGGHLEEDRAEPQGMGMSGSVFPGADHVQRAGSRWCGGLGAGLREEKFL
jgi:hypothetical protein